MLPCVWCMQCRTVGAGDEEPIRLSPYTAASFARLLSHSLRFLKLDSLHTNQVQRRRIPCTIDTGGL